MSWEARLEAALGEWALPVVVWSRVDAPDLVVYAFSSRRLATLRHWRDEVETPTFVGLEASKWARLLLKGHGGSLLSCGKSAADDCLGMSARLQGMAVELWNEDATHWAELADAAPPERALLTGFRPISGGERFERVNSWLEDVRIAADATRT
jgi:hypothetical protein